MVLLVMTLIDIDAVVLHVAQVEGVGFDDFFDGFYRDSLNVA